MPFADTHIHLDFEVFDGQRSELLDECSRIGIDMLVVPGVTRASWSHCHALADSSPAIKCALGLHPYFLFEHCESDLQRLDEQLACSEKNVVAVGEIGLDDTCPNLDLQKFYFEQQLDLAAKHNLPVIMHMRRNHGMGWALVRKLNLSGGVVHAFSGSFQDAMSWVELGMKIGVGGVITYERAQKTRSTIARLPLNSLVLETDAPDMAIQGAPKGQGSPLMVKDIFEILLSLRTESEEELKSALWSNSVSLFGTPS